MHYSLFLAHVYLRSIKNNKNVASMLIITYFSIVVGSFAVALVFSIMHGFEKATYATLQNIYPSFYIQSDGQPINVDKLTTYLHAHFPQISGISPTTIAHVLIKVGHEQDLSHVALLKGIDPLQEAQTTTLEKKIITPCGTQVSLQNCLSNNTILIGHKLAEQLNKTVGDTLTILYAPAHDTEDVQLKQTSFQIGGIFKTGIEELDHDMIIGSLSLVTTLFPDTPITTIGIKAPDEGSADFVTQLKHATHLSVFSWKELYPALLAALTLEKYAAFLVIALMMLIACLSVVSLLFIIIHFKRRDCAILMIMGMPLRNVQQIFIYLGMIITISAAIPAISAAWLVSWILKKYTCITLPDMYYVQHLPTITDPLLYITIFIGIALLCWIVLYATTRLLKTLDIASVLRFEA